MIGLTPQLAKLIVLRWAKASSDKWDDFTDMAGILSEEESIMLRKALENYKKDLQSYIVYQERIYKNAS